MKALILGNGTLSELSPEYYGSGIRVICADGGYNHAKRLGIPVDLVLGDMDSIAGRVEEIPTVVYPVRKDYTDGEIAVGYAIEQGFEEVVLAGFTGDRMDHTLTNIFLLRRLCRAGIQASLVDANNKIFYLTDRIRLTGKKGDTLSIVPVKGDLEGVETKGLEYPLCRETLYFGQSRGVSNVFAENTCEISVEKGEGLVILVKKV